jgi:hypothetical protein
MRVAFLLQIRQHIFKAVEKSPLTALPVAGSILGSPLSP